MVTALIVIGTVSLIIAVVAAVILGDTNHNNIFYYYIYPIMKWKEKTIPKLQILSNGQYYKIQEKYGILPWTTCYDKISTLQRAKEEYKYMKRLHEEKTAVYKKVDIAEESPVYQALVGDRDNVL